LVGSGALLLLFSSPSDEGTNHTTQVYCLLQAEEHAPFDSIRQLVQVGCPLRRTNRQAISILLLIPRFTHKKKLLGNSRLVAKARERGGRNMNLWERTRRKGTHLRRLPSRCKSRCMNEEKTNRPNVADGLLNETNTMLINNEIGSRPLLYFPNFMLQHLRLQHLLMVSLHLY